MPVFVKKETQYIKKIDKFSQPKSKKTNFAVWIDMSLKCL